MHDDEFIQEGRGRSAKKRAAKAVEALAVQLVELPDAQLANLPLDDDLRRELAQARSTKGHSARKRQVKYFAGLLRHHEAQQVALEEALANLSLEKHRQTLNFHHLEVLRDRFCSQDTFESALTDAAALYPDLDVAKITSLARSVHANGDKKAAREIFRHLRKAEEMSSNDTE